MMGGTGVVYVSLAASGEIVVLHELAQAPYLKEVQRLHLGGAIMPMAIHPLGHRLYAVGRSEPFIVHTLAIHPDEGTLTPLGQAALPGNMVYVATTRDGRHLLTASYGEDFIAVHAIDGQGCVGDLMARMPTSRQAHAILPAPGGDKVWVSCLGGNEMRCIGLDALTGALSTSPLRTLATRPGSGPRHFVFHPDAPWCYVINEVDGTVDLLDVAPDGASLTPKQSLSIMPAGFAEPPWGGDIRLSWDGMALFATDRRSGTLSACRIEAGTGRLHLTDQLVTGGMPRSMASSRLHTRVYVADQQGGQVDIVAHVPKTGALQSLARQAIGPSPTWVETLRLPA
ncbi:MAG: beta-propeller fold lactonase family protein [Aquabacterium sp.]